MEPDREEFVIPVVEEEIDASTRAVKTGSVRVDKHVEKRFRTVEAPLIHEDVEIHRVPAESRCGCGSEDTAHGRHLDYPGSGRKW